MQEMQKSNRLIYTVISTALIIVVDQITKLIISENMDIGESFRLIPYIINIHYVRNKGAAFGMLADQRWIFMTFSVLALGIMFFILKKTKKRSHLFYISMAFIIGGGIGNMIDRTAYGSVIDFVEFDFVDFAVFNIADAFLTVGVIMMAVYLLFFEKKDKQDIDKAKETNEKENEEKPEEESEEKSEEIQDPEKDNGVIPEDNGVIPENNGGSDET